MTPETLFSPLVEQAIELAAEWHEGTYRKSRWRGAPFVAPEGTVLRIPAMAHATAVALTVQRAGWEDEVVAGAFLHDVLEDANRFDQAMRRADLEGLVGEEVVRLVAAVTEPKRDDDGAFLPWIVRKEAYLERLAAGPPGSAAISLADKLHNAYTMNGGLEAGIDIFSSEEGPGRSRRGLSAGPEAQRCFFEAVLEATERHDDARLVPMRARLRREVERFAALAGL